MSTLSEQFAREEEARKAKKKTKEKKTVKNDADLDTPSL